MNCYHFKGGSGTASRIVEHGTDTYSVGVFVQANFGARKELVIAGVPVGRELADDDPMADPSCYAPAGAGSVIAIVATDAPLLPGQCKALARRVPLGLARTGTTGSHFSGDIFLAFSTGNHGELAIGLGTATAAGAYGTLRFVPWVAHGSVLRGRRAGHRGGGAQRAVRRRGDDRRERPPFAGPPARARARAARGRGVTA